MISKFISILYKRLTRFSVLALLVISVSGVTPLFLSAAAQAAITGPVGGIFINEFSSYGDNDWIELYNSNSSTVSLNGLSLQYGDPVIRVELDGYILGRSYVVIDVGDNLNRDGGTFRLSNGSSIQLINYGNTTAPGYIAIGAPGEGLVAARTQNSDYGYTWMYSNTPTPGAHNNPPFAPPTIVSPANKTSQEINTVTFSWQPIQGAGLYSLAIYDDPNFTQVSSRDSNGARYLPWSTERTYTFDEGTYYWRVSAYRSGVWSPWSEIYTFTVDSAPPSVGFAEPSPENNSYINSDFDVAFKAYDSNKLDSVSVSLLDNDNPIPSEQWKAGCSYTELDTSDLMGTCNIQLPSDLPDGSYTLQIEGQDQAGFYAAVQSRAIQVDRTKPIDPVLLGPTNGFATQSYNITHTWTDSSSDVDYYIYESYDDAGATSLRSSETVTDTSMASTYPEDVTYWWRVKAIDKAGNESDWSDLWIVTIDNTAPEFTGETSYTLLPGEKITLTPIVNEVNVTYQWALGDDNKQILANRNSSLIDSTLSIGRLPKGEYTVTLILTDQLGNSTDPIKYKITVSTPSLFRQLAELLVFID